MKELKALFYHPYFQHFLFWVTVLLYSIFSSSLAASMGARQSIEIYGTIVLCQFIAAVVCLNFLIPRVLEKGHRLLFVLALLLLMFLLFALYITIRMSYLEVQYFDHYNRMMADYIQLGFWERLFDFRLYLSKGLSYLSPTILILALRYYREQQKFLKLNEQKKIAELSALKNQLNPHFLFNTLNNLYMLALKKSDKTPEVISKLSDILDYMLYRCNDKFVSLRKEIELIENYITLEKVRYGKRADVSFNTSVNEEVKIAPLLLLTFIENAFKHGVSQEINQANLDIDLSSDEDGIHFSVKNTIPNGVLLSTEDKESIGLKNVKKQLALLYPNTHHLKIDQSKTHYSVQLKIQAQ